MPSLPGGVVLSSAWSRSCQLAPMCSGPATHPAFSGAVQTVSAHAMTQWEPGTSELRVHTRARQKFDDGGPLSSGGSPGHLDALSCSGRTHRSCWDLSCQCVLLWRGADPWASSWDRSCRSLSGVLSSREAKLLSSGPAGGYCREGARTQALRDQEPALPPIVRRWAYSGPSAALLI